MENWIVRNSKMLANTGQTEEAVQNIYSSAPFMSIFLKKQNKKT